MMYYCYENTIIEDIENAKNMYIEQDKKARHEEYMKNLSFNEYVRKIKKNVSRYDYFPDIFRLAQNEKDNKLKKERANFEQLKTMLLDDFFDNDTNFKLTNIMSCGYENYAWCFYFEGYGKVVSIYIPVMKNIDNKNVEYARYGRFCFLEEEKKMSGKH